MQIKAERNSSTIQMIMIMSINTFQTSKEKLTNYHPSRFLLHSPSIKKVYLHLFYFDEPDTYKAGTVFMITAIYFRSLALSLNVSINVFSQYLSQQVTCFIGESFHADSIYFISWADGVPISRKMSQSILNMQVFLLKPLPSSLAALADCSEEHFSFIPSEGIMKG